MTRVQREALVLVALILTVDAGFVAAYFLTQIRNGSDTGKLAFTALWTIVTLAVVIRGLSRIRGARRNPRG
ncbi:MAG TPA: hypothetical protein VFS51_12385 [Gemmatimonadales bacterium]|nr:hypothetical protein [Gemmatimonadales bacterium]